MNFGSIEGSGRVTFHVTTMSKLTKNGTIAGRKRGETQSDPQIRGAVGIGPPLWRR